MEVTERNEQLELAMQRVAKWEEDGTLEQVDRVLHLLKAAMDSMTPEIVEGMIGSIVSLVELGDQVMNSKVMDIVPSMLATVDTIVANPPEKQHGVTKLMKRMRDPEVQDGLQFMMEFVKAIGHGVKTED